MGVFRLKYRDTRPTLEVTLKDPDGSVHDLTGATDFYLHVRLTDGTVVTRTMQLVGPPTAGTLSYAWVAADWDVSNPAGHLIVGPTLPPPKGTFEHRMEYEVVGGTSRLTFPSEDYDVLRVWDDIGQG